MSHYFAIRAGLVFAVMSASATAFGADVPPLEIHGTLDAVTVYRGQALVSRLVEIPGPAGLKEVTVTGLPDQIEPGSIYAESADGAEVQSVNYSSHPVETDVRDAVRKYDDEIRDLQDKITGLQQHRAALDAQRETLIKLDNFTAATATTDLNKGALNADTVEKLAQFQFTERNRIVEESLKLDAQIRTLNDQLQTSQRQRAQVATSSSKIAREAKVLVNLAGNGGKVRVRYIVDNATWQPSYNLRVDSAAAAGAAPAGAPPARKATLEYLASIQQLSGEDWTNVQMTLSTATPSLVAKAPILNELAITLSGPGKSDTVDVLTKLEQAGGSEQARADLQQQRAAIEQFRSTIGASNTAGVSNLTANNITINGTVVNLDYIGDNNDVDLLLNRTAGDLQLVDLAVREKIARDKSAKPAQQAPDQGLAITYQLANHTSLLSRSDRQTIRIANIPLQPTFYKVAQPVLNSYVYDEALAVNNSPYVLLYGDLATYVDNQFVGRGVLPSVAIGQSLEVGLGIDSSLRAHRSLVEKAETTSGGNRVVDFTYRLSIENFGSAPAQVRLYDRLPMSKEITVSAGTSAKGLANDKEIGPKKPLDEILSQDPLYLQDDRKKNILRWDLDVPEKSIDNKAYTVEYQFQLSYDKNLAIAVPVPPPAAPATQPQNGNNGGGFGNGNNGGGFGGGGGRGGRAGGAGGGGGGR